MSDIEEAFETQRSLADSIALECLREIFHQLPKEHNFQLSNGKTGQLKPLSEPYIHEETGEIKFHYDVWIDGFALDHIEFTMKKSGSGGFVLDDSNPVAAQ